MWELGNNIRPVRFGGISVEAESFIFVAMGHGDSVRNGTFACFECMGVGRRAPEVGARDASNAALDTFPDMGVYQLLKLM